MALSRAHINLLLAQSRLPSVPQSQDFIQPPPLTQDQIDAIQTQINALKAIELSGVNSAGYGDKRTEFRSLADLRQIIGDAEAALTGMPRVRQIRMTTQADKGL